MSTRLCLFGVDPAVDDNAVLAAARAWLEDVPQRPASVYVGIQEREKIRARRWFYFLLDKGWHWTFEATAQALAMSFPELTAVLYNDGNGVHKLEQRQKGDGGKPALVFGINTVGPYIDVYQGTLQGSYPQSGYSVEELRALNDKPWEAMSERERDAVSDYASATTIGINELFPGDERTLIGMGYEKVFHQIVDQGALIAPVAVRERDLPAGLWNFPREWDGSVYS